MELATKSRMFLDRLKVSKRAVLEYLDRKLPSTETVPGEKTEFLPNFCTGEVVFNVVVVAEMLAIVINLIIPRNFLSPTALQDLLLVSIFIQWVALAGTAVLCYTRRYLNRLPNLPALGLAYLLLLLTTFVVSECTVWLLWGIGRIQTARPAWYADFHILNLTISAIVNGLLLRLFLAKHELTQRTMSEARAKLQALQSRIRPHFVFNSLNIIASLTRSEPAKAEAAIENMADLFRMMLSQDENLVPVKNEIDVANKYLALEALRLENRLTVNWDIGKFPRKAVMPVLTLQPLLENAIRHGIEDLATGGVVDVRLWEENDRIYIRVSNPLPQVRSRPPKTMPGQSLENIRQRFQSHYGEEATLHSTEEDGRFTVTVVLPTRGGNP
ncbi:MAG: histidine kinase [Sulfuricaulis sp.]|uniref:sensor histidine kinase n=1 Tax=Sulfuricaulis sp. TaxID=2003553 RepID=UPI0034A429B0